MTISAADLMNMGTRDTRQRNETLRTNYDDFAGDLVIRHRMLKLKQKIAATSAIYKVFGDNYNGMVTLEGNLQYSFQILDVTDISQKIDKLKAIRPTAEKVLNETYWIADFQGQRWETPVKRENSILEEYLKYGVYFDKSENPCRSTKARRSAAFEALQRMSMPEIKEGEMDKIDAAIKAGREGVGRYIVHTPDNRLSNHINEISYLCDQPFCEVDPIDTPKVSELTQLVGAVFKHWKYFK